MTIERRPWLGFLNTETGRREARDELYMRLRTEAGLSHQHATEFLAECPSYERIRHALDRYATFGAVMGTLVVWIGKNESVYREAARRCGWGY